MEKLLKEAEAARSGDATSSSRSSSSRSLAGKAALKLRPNVASMAEAEDDLDDDEDDDEEEDGGDDGVYRPPKLTATQFIANEKEVR